MILYTPLAMEDVLLNEEEQKVIRSCVNYEGKMFYVDKFPNGEHRLAQLVSTNPNDYLNTSYTPGETLH